MPNVCINLLTNLQIAWLYLLSPVPEPGPEIVRAGDEAGVCGAVDDQPHRGVVSQAQQLLPARVPNAEHMKMIL